MSLDSFAQAFRTGLQKATVPGGAYSAMDFDAPEPMVVPSAYQAKHPHEMTRAEYIAHHMGNGPADRRVRSVEFRHEGDHYLSVANAVRSGKIVPAHVLADYPNMMSARPLPQVSAPAPSRVKKVQKVRIVHPAGSSLSLFGDMDKDPEFERLHPRGEQETVNPKTGKTIKPGQFAPKPEGGEEKNGTTEQMGASLDSKREGESPDTLQATGRKRKSGKNGAEGTGSSDGLGGIFDFAGEEPADGVAGSGVQSQSTDGAGRAESQQQPVSDVVAPDPEIHMDAAEEEFADMTVHQFQGVMKGGNNYRITEADEIGKGSDGQKFNDNLSAIMLLKEIEEAGRQATPEEQSVLVKYTGWGWAGQLFHPDNDSTYAHYHNAWKSKHDQLKAILTPEEWRSAGESAINAHYTAPAVISAMWDAMKHLGFDKGRILEPSSGVGHFLGMMPGEMWDKSPVTAVELDSLTGRFAKQLYQSADVQITGFEHSDTPEKFYDLAISNVPFANVAVNDPVFGAPGLKYLRASLHNYFFVKALTKLRENGICAFITSSATMDAPTRRRIREYLGRESELLGAIRLPNDAFKGNAGTEVTTDILFLRKRVKGETPSAEEPAWSESLMLQTPDGPTEVNQYFHAHPEMMLGTMGLQGTQYRKGQPALISDGRDLGEALQEAIKRLPEGIYQSSTTEAVKKPEVDLSGYTIGNFIEKDGELFQVEAGERVDVGQDEDGNTIYARGAHQLVPAGLAGLRAERVRGMIKVREAALSLVRVQADPAMNEAQYLAARGRANAHYDAFVKKYGHVHDNANLRLFVSDSDGIALLCSLEDYDPESKSVKGKGDILLKRTAGAFEKATRAGNAKEAMLHSLNEEGALNFERMASLTGSNPERVMQDLSMQRLIYHNPQGGWETADDYLSGEVRNKLRAAQAAVKIEPRYQANVDALLAVQPPDLTPGQIEARLGVGWVETDDVKDFIHHLLGVPDYETRSHARVRYIPETATWVVAPPHSQYTNSAKATKTWGTDAKPAMDLIDATLNMQVPIVRENIGTYGDPKWVVEPEATAAAQQKQQEINDEFKRWIWSDDKRATRLARKYNDMFNDSVPRTFNGQHLELPGLSDFAKDNMLSHVKDAIWRQLQTPNTLLDHCVGAGKTWEVTCAALEMRRLGLCRKPLITVPNHLVSQWATAIKQLYPNSKVLTATKKDFEAGNRERFFARAAAGDWDAIVVAHTSFGRIPLQKETENEFYQSQIDELQSVMDEVEEEEGNKSNTFKELVKQRKRLQTKLKDRMDKQEENASGSISFEQMGVDRLFVDEAHCFPYETLVLTDRGLLPIGKIVCEKLPVFVLSAELNSNTLEWKAVTDWFNNPQSAPMVRIEHENGFLECTANHKIWTEEEGYVRADSLTRNHTLREFTRQDMPGLPGGVHSSAWDDRKKTGSLRTTVPDPRTQEDGDETLRTMHQRVLVPFYGADQQRQAAVLRRTVRSNMAHVTAGNTGKIQGEHGSYVCQQSLKGQEVSREFDTHEGEQSYEASRSAREDAQGYVGANLSGARRERADYQAAGSGRVCARSADGVRHNHNSGARSVPDTASPLQGGYSGRSEDAGYRDRWSLSQLAKMEVSGQAQDGSLERSRVVGVTLLERAGGYATGNGSGGDTRVYCLEVADNHNFFAEGVLVSNCFKNLWFPTRMSRLKGLPNSESQRAFDMFMKVRHIQKTNNGGGVVFATGTPISNTIAEMYTMQRYLDPDWMKQKGMGHFDAWAKNFGENRTEIEQTVAGLLKPTTRFAKFHNVAELVKGYSRFADTKTHADLKLPTPEVERHMDGPDVIAMPSKEQMAYVDHLAARAENMKNVLPEVDNMLKITSEGRLNALDPRLLVPNAPDPQGGKVNLCVANVAKVYHETAADKLTQLVFLDLSTPKANEGNDLDPIDRAREWVKDNIHNEYGRAYAQAWLRWKNADYEGKSGDIEDEISENDRKIDEMKESRKTDTAAYKNAVKKKRSLSESLAKSRANEAEPHFRDFYRNNSPLTAENRLHRDTQSLNAIHDEITSKLQSVMSGEEGQETEQEVSLRGSVYADIRQKLHAKGILPKEIAFVHEAKTDAQKQAMFDGVRSGRIRVLIGSTEKMGTGMNVQHKMIALHHIDCPWRPDQLEQREGRIVRQGNSNKKVHIYSYSTSSGDSDKLSTDSFMWQTCKTKAESIAQLKNNKSNIREIEDIDSTASMAAMMQCYSSNNPLLREHVDVSDKLQKLGYLSNAHTSTQWEIKKKLEQLPGDISTYQRKAQSLTKAVEHRDKNKPEKFKAVVMGTTYDKASEAGTEILNHAINAKKAKRTAIVQVGTYGGFNISVSSGSDFDQRGYVFLTVPGQETAITGFSLNSVRSADEPPPPPVTENDSQVVRAAKERAIKEAKEESSDPGGHVISLIQRDLRILTSAQEQAQIKAEKADRDLAELKTQVMPFPKQEELNALQLRAREIQQLLAVRETEMAQQVDPNDGTDDEEQIQRKPKADPFTNQVKKLPLLHNTMSQYQVEGMPKKGKKGEKPDAVRSDMPQMLKSLLYQGGKFTQGSASADTAPGPSVDSNLSKMNAGLYHSAQSAFGNPESKYNVVSPHLASDVVPIAHAATAVNSSGAKNYAGETVGLAHHTTGVRAQDSVFGHVFHSQTPGDSAALLQSHLSGTHHITKVDSPGDTERFVAEHKTTGAVHHITVASPPTVKPVSPPQAARNGFRAGASAPAVPNTYAKTPGLAPSKPSSFSGVGSVASRVAGAFRSALTTPLGSLFQKQREVDHSKAAPIHQAADSLDMKHYASKAGHNGVDSHFYTHETPGKSAEALQAHFHNSGHTVSELNRTKVYANGIARHAYSFNATSPEGVTHTVNVIKGPSARYGADAKTAKPAAAAKVAREPMEEDEQRNFVHGMAGINGATLRSHSVGTNKKDEPLERHKFAHVDPQAAATALHQTLRQNGFTGAGPQQYRGKWGFQVGHEGGGPTHRIDFHPA